MFPQANLACPASWLQALACRQRDSICPGPDGEENPRGKLGGLGMGHVPGFDGCIARRLMTVIWDNIIHYKDKDILSPG